jgi:hypothetical protein
MLQLANDQIKFIDELAGILKAAGGKMPYTTNEGRRITFERKFFYLLEAIRKCSGTAAPADREYVPKAVEYPDGGKIEFIIEEGGPGIKYTLPDGSSFDLYENRDNACLGMTYKNSDGTIWNRLKVGADGFTMQGVGDDGPKKIASVEKWIDIPVTWDVNVSTTNNGIVRYNPSAKLLFISFKYLLMSIPSPVLYNISLGNITLPAPINDDIYGIFEVEHRKSGSLLNRNIALLGIRTSGEIFIRAPADFDYTINYSNLEIRGSVMWALLV